MKKQLEKTILHLKHDIGRLNGEDAATIQKNFQSIVYKIVMGKGRNIPRICALYNITDDVCIQALSRIWGKFIHLQKQGSKMLFLADIEDEKFRDMLQKVKSHDSTRDRNYEEILKDFSKDIKNIVHNFARQKKVKPELEDDLFSLAHEYIYDVIQKFDIPETNVYSRFKDVLKKLGFYLRDNYREDYSEDVTGSSYSTRHKALKMLRWIEDYRQKHHMRPNLQTIAKQFDTDEDTVQRQLDAIGRPTYINDTNGEHSITPNPLHSHLNIPHEQFSKKDEKNFLKHTVNKIKDRMKKEEFNRLHGRDVDIIRENWDKLFFKFANGVGFRAIAKDFNILDGQGVKQIERLYRTFIEYLQKDKELKEYYLTARKKRMQKISAIMYSNNFEDNLIKKIIKK